MDAYDRSQFSENKVCHELYTEASTLRFPVATHEWPRTFTVTGLGVFEQYTAGDSRAVYINGRTGDTAIIFND